MSNDTLPQLSEREREILRLVATGATNQQIAAQLNISANTVKVHLRNIFGKIGVASRTEATMYAVRNGLLEVLPATLSAPVAEAAPETREIALPLQPDEPPRESGYYSHKPVLGHADARRRSIVGGVIGATLLVVIVVALTLREMLFASRPVSEMEVSLPAPKDRWRVLEAMPSARAGFALCVYGYNGRQYLYAIGGETSDGVTGQVIRFDSQTNTWVQLSSKPTPTADVQAVTVGDRVFVPGGRLSSGEISAVFEAYEPQRDRWVTLASLPAPRSGYALAAIEGKVYLFGGWDGHSYHANVWQYNPDDNIWQERTPLTTPRAFAGAVTYENRVYVIGGEGAEGPLTLNEVYAAAEDANDTDPWSTRSPLPSARSRMTVVTVGGLIFVLGGADQESSSLLYHVNRDSWEPLNLPLDARLQNLRAQIVDNKILVAGGSDARRLSAQVFEYQAIYTVFLPLVPGG